MPADPRLDGWLDRWEALRRRGLELTPEEFLAGFRGEIPTPLAEEFRRQALALGRIDQRLDRAQAMPDAAARPAELTTLEAGREPVAGYVLVDRLGRGGFGEVWKARGPGGFHVALKFVPLGPGAGTAEPRALEIVREIRHPHLLATVGVWQTGGFLVIAMELAERTLLDRFREAVAQGSSGIPGPELREYMIEAAKGLDYLNEPRHPSGGKEPLGIQHRDVKPQNLLLAGGGVKVADFGLVRLLEHSVTGHTGGMTPAYAAPEFFRLETSAQSDQYSLAVSYCQLRGGRLPFSGSPVEVMAGHLHRAPDLTMLPDSERPAVARALAKAPKDRWPSCRAFVAALETGTLMIVPATIPGVPDGRLATEAPPSFVTPGRHPSRRLLIGIAAVALVLPIGGLLVLRPWRDDRVRPKVADTSTAQRPTKPPGPVTGPPSPVEEPVLPVVRPPAPGGTSAATNSERQHASPPTPAGTLNFVDEEPGEFEAPAPPGPNPARPHVEQGRKFWVEGQIAEAIVELTEAIRLDPKLYRAHYWRGCSYFVKGDIDRAIGDFDEVIHHGNAYIPVAYNMRGRSYSRKGLYVLALRDLDEAIRRKPNSGVFYYRRGEIHAQAGHPVKAEADRRKATQLDPEFVRREKASAEPAKPKGRRPSR